ncbi:hypothetical protein SAMN05428949_4015 [Chitinophaga sp. YR627]|uniref:hypothetical protein n=1 Tax=Chitinophaga sp. YR627 TaxID=1881041 RepID=UPI0008E3AC1E|nr:hypothetical protein [Chitinophaga sp. YR627]SFN97524.1 hypothetical protein SAMN05428949_4015 [Chitinophaga sp. YR627]
MKRILFSICLLVGLASASMAQSAQYEGAMTKQVAMLDDSTNFTPDRLLEIANTFERIGAAEKSQWLPFYYAGYCYVMSTFMQKDNDKVDDLADKAAVNIEQAEAISPKNDEINCIKSLIATSRIRVDPMNRGMKYGMESANLLVQANQINQENPRVYMLQGQSLFYTPEQFGGSKTEAKKKFEVALQKFSSFKPASSIAPHWGEAYTKGLIAQIK